MAESPRGGPGAGAPLMPRIRTLKPELWLSPQVMNLTHGARLLFLGLITQADDEGRGCADPRRLKAAIFGGDDCTSSSVRAWLEEIVAQRLAVTYDGGDHGELYEIPTWSEHQSIDRPRKSRYPSSSSLRRNIVEPSSKAREGSEGSEGSKGSDLTRARPKSGKAVDNSGEEPDGLKTDAETRRRQLRAAIADPTIIPRLTA